MTASENHAPGSATSARSLPGDSSSTSKPFATRPVTFGVGLSHEGVCLVGVPQDVRTALHERWTAEDRRGLFDYPNTGDFWSDLRRLEGAEPIACCVVVACESVEAALAEMVAGCEASPHAVSVVLLVPRASAREVVLAMRAGMTAVVDDAADLPLLLEYIDRGLATAATELLQRVRCLRVVAALRELSDGERGVMLGILSGKLNKEIAQEMSLSVRTIEQRRREVFRKVGVHHPASLGSEVTRAFLNPRLRPADREYVARLMDAIPGWHGSSEATPARAIRIDQAHSGPSRAGS